MLLFSELTLGCSPDVILVHFGEFTLANKRLGQNPEVTYMALATHA